MSLLAIANIISEINGETIKLRILDLDTKRFKDMLIEEVVEMVSKDISKYRDTNLYLLTKHGDEAFAKYIYSYLPEIVNNQPSNEDEYYYVFKKLGKYNRYLMVDTVGNVTEVGDVESSMYQTTNIQYDTDRHIVFIEGLIADKYEHKDTEKEREIRNKYNKFLAKCNVLGIDNRFEYIVEKDDVILTEFTGRSSKVIVPSFITTIGSYAFNYFDHANSDIEEPIIINEVLLSEGLKTICYNAFSNLDITSITIPSTVELIEKSAFVDCSINNYSGGIIIKKDGIKLLNQNTIVEDFIV